MKAWYVIAILTLLLLVAGCEQAVVEEEAAAEAPAEEEAAAEAPAEEEAAPEVTDAQQSEIERFTEKCKAGSLKLCLVLKNKYGIDVNAEEEAPAEEEAAAEAPAAEDETPEE